MSCADRKTLFEMLYADGFLDVFDNQFSIMAIDFEQFKTQTGKAMENACRENTDRIGNISLSKQAGQ